MFAAAGWLGSSPFATFLLNSLWWSKSLFLIWSVILCVLTWPHLSDTVPGLNWHMVWLGVMAQYSGNPGFVLLSDFSLLLHFKASLQSLHPTGVPLQLPPNDEEKQFPESENNFDLKVNSFSWSYQQWILTEEVLHTSQSSPHHHCKGKCMVPHLDWSICQHLWCCHLQYHNLHIQAPPLHTEPLYYSLHILKGFHHMSLQTVLGSRILGCCLLLEDLEFNLSCHGCTSIQQILPIYLTSHPPLSWHLYSQTSSR